MEEFVLAFPTRHSDKGKTTFTGTITGVYETVSGLDWWYCCTE